MSNEERGVGKGRWWFLVRGRQSRECVECYKFHKLGYYQSECLIWEENANYVEFNEEEEMILMAKSDSKSCTKEEIWYFDSGCNNRMVGVKTWFFEFDGSSVKLEDNSKMSFMEKENVKLSIGSKTHMITDVYYLPGLRNNLFSIGKLQQKNLNIVFKHDSYQIFHE